MNTIIKTDPAVTSGANKSFWIATAPDLRFSPIADNIKTDVLVVGGGIAGLTTAYMLLKQGRKVVLVEDGLLGSGESGRTTAHLASALDNRYYFLEETFDAASAKLAAESHVAAIEMIASIIRAENIECSFKRVDGYLFLHPSDKKENLDKEFDATQRAGLQTYLESNVPGIANGSHVRCIKFSNQAQFHVTKYLAGLAEAIVNLGGMIYTETRAKDVNIHGAKANSFKIDAEHIVIATNTPANDLFTMHTKQHAYRSYVIGFKINKDVLPHLLWWDSGDADSKWVSQPYHYVRLENLDDNYDLLIAGGEDHKTGQAEDENIPEEQRYVKLEAWTREHFPAVEDVAYKWSGQIMEPLDCLGYLGKNPGDDNIYIITGDSGNGMTHTTIGAKIITDIITGVSNPWEKLYSPSRITLNVAGDYLKETGNMAKQYLDILLPSHLKEVKKLKPGEGGVITSGVSKVAVYIDENNSVHKFSAICPHLGCVVKWNADEKSFDCPCHGSRFNGQGTVMNGPAMSGLSVIE